MEKYTVQLEELVAQRTAALQEEKKNADLLLYRMLPLYVPLHPNNQIFLVLKMTLTIQYIIHISLPYVHF